MAVAIRLKRLGAKKRPTFRFIAADSRSPRDGRFIETLGYYNPIEKPATIRLHEDRMVHWLNEGGSPSHTVLSLLRQIGFWEKYTKMKKGEDVSAMEIKSTITERKKKFKKKEDK